MTAIDPHKAIAVALAADAPQGWDVVWTQGDVGEDYSDLLFAGVLPGEKTVYFTPSYENNELIHRSLQAIRAQLQEAGSRNWSHYRFTLRSCGRFDLHVDHTA